MVESKMQVETTERELTFTRIFHAPRDLVFETFSACKHLERWWGPREWPLANCEMDFREGGEWDYCMKGPEGELACGKAVYKEIRKPSRLVYQDFFVDEHGMINDQLPSGLVTFEFADVNGTTRITGRTEYQDPADLQTVLEMGMVAGMTETLDRLEEHILQILDQK